MNNAGVYNQMKGQQEFGGQIQMMDEDTDWSKLV
jgi:hypothetical protein